MTAPIEEMPDLPFLLDSLFHAKRIEQSSTEFRRKIESDLINRLEFTQQEGSKTFKDGEFEGYKVTLTAKLDRKLDDLAYLQVQSLIPSNMRPVRQKLELDVKGYKWLETSDPETFKIMAGCVTTKPSKTSVSIEKIEVMH